MLQEKRRVAVGLDVCKAVCCLLITASHLPSFFSSEIVDAYFNQWFFRFCVPFFFVCSGYFFQKSNHKGRSILRIALLTAIAYLLYLPRILDGVQSVGDVLSRLRWNLVIGYEHLWYLNATLEGMIIWYLLEKIPGIRVLFCKAGGFLAVVLLLSGALLNEYYSLLNIPVLNAIGDLLMNFGGPRNVVFMGFPLLVLGAVLARRENLLSKVPTVYFLLLWVGFRLLAFWECSVLFELKGLALRNDLTFFGCWPGVVLVMLALRIQLPLSDSLSKLLRKMAEYVYILHPLVASLLTRYLPMAPLTLWIATIAVSCGICLLVQKAASKLRK